MRSLPRRGTTLLDVTVALAVMALVASIAVPRVGVGLDRHRTRAAAADLATVYAVARQAAIARAAFVTLHLDAPGGIVRVIEAADTLVVRPLGNSHGVSIATTRERSVFSPLGLGWGSANATIVVSRGRATDTVVVSRLGRVRRSGLP